MSGARVPGHAHMSGSPAYDDLLWAVAILPIVLMMQKNKWESYPNDVDLRQKKTRLVLWSDADLFQPDYVRNCVKYTEMKE